MRLTVLPVVVGSAMLLGAGFATTVVLPTSDTANTRHTASTRAYGTGVSRGVEAYVNHGCVLCHTQQVRDAYTDAGLGSRPMRPGDTLSDRPGQLGTVRFGPDLACIGDWKRLPGRTGKAQDDLKTHIDQMVAYLTAPSSVHAGSTMPAYDYLSEKQLYDLAAYLVSLTCEDVR